MNEAIMSPDFFTKAAEEYMEAYLSSLPENGEVEHEFSSTFKAIMEKIIRRFERSKLLRGLAYKAAAILLALAIGAGMLISLNDDASAKIQGWVRSVTESKIIYSFNVVGTEDQHLPTLNITWLPDGYELVALGKTDSRCLMTFRHKGSNNLMVISYFIVSRSAELTINAGNDDARKITINGCYGEILEGEGQSTTITMLDEEHGCFVYLDSYMDTKTLLRIARGIEIRD